MDKKDDLPGKVEAFMAVASAARDSADWRPIEHDLPNLWSRFKPKGRSDANKGGGKTGPLERQAVPEAEARDKGITSGKKKKR